MIRKIAKNVLSGKMENLMTLVWNRLPFNNVFHVKRGNAINLNGNYLVNSKIIIKGKNNVIDFQGHGKNYLKNCIIRIYGNSNHIVFGSRNSLVGVELWIEDNNNEIKLGNNNILLQGMHIAVTEGVEFEMGNDNVFSSNCVFRTGDSHSIIDRETHSRINKAQSIRIGNKVWSGAHVTILKGTNIPNDTVIATGSIVTSKFSETNTVIGGIPAKIIKKNIYWEKERL